MRWWNPKIMKKRDYIKVAKLCLKNKEEFEDGKEGVVGKERGGKKD
jgi:hypothetical protein